MARPDKVRIGVCQLAVQADKVSNIRRAMELLTQAKAKGCNVAVLPEMFNCPYEVELFPSYAEETPGGETFTALQQGAKELQMAVIGGSIPEKTADGKVYNTCLIFDAAGDLVAKHRKVHLFDVELSGGTVIQESATLTAGEAATVVELAGIPFGVGICYDMRFGELARAMTDHGALVLVYPAAFGPVTGPAHWELTLRARAVDQQVFTIGAAPAPTPGAKYQAYGHSVVVDPWGKILSQAGTAEAVLDVELDFSELWRIRQELPLLRHRKAFQCGIFGINRP